MAKRLWIIILIAVSHSVFAQEAPPVTAPAEKVAASDAEVIQSETEKFKQLVLEEKVQMQLLRFLTKKEGIGSGSTKLVIDYATEMSERYKIYSLVYKLDGQVVYSFFYGDSVGKIEQDRKPRAFTQPLAPGSHVLEIQLVHTGNDTGVFSYLNDYKILTERKIPFEVKKETQTTINLVAFEKGWILTDFKERPDLSVKINGQALP